MLSFDQASLHPLTTDALIEKRVADLVGRAVRRQLWFLFLDEHDVQLPLIMPCDDIPLVPPDQLMLGIADFVEAAGASSVVAVIERYGPESLTDSDRAWASHLRSSCTAASVRLRATLLSHRRGIRWIAPDDYAF